MLSKTRMCSLLFIEAVTEAVAVSRDGCFTPEHPRNADKALPSQSRSTSVTVALQRFLSVFPYR
jgi:hypothetical protein